LKNAKIVWGPLRLAVIRRVIHISPPRSL